MCACYQTSQIIVRLKNTFKEEFDTNFLVIEEVHQCLTYTLEKYMAKSKLKCALIKRINSDCALI